MAIELRVDKPTAFRNLRRLGFTLKLHTWVSHKLNNLNRTVLTVSFLARCITKLFFDRLVTGDEKWILYKNIQRKRT